MFPLAPLPRTLQAALRDVTHKKLEVRISAIKDLGRHATSTDGSARGHVVEALLGVLEGDSAPGMRAEAAVALADAEANEAVPALLRAARDPAPWVRQMVLLALGEVASPSDEAVIDLLRESLDDVAPEFRFQALVALHHLAPVEPVADGAQADPVRRAVEAKLSDSDASVRYIALRILEERWANQPATRAAVVRLAEPCLRDAEPKVRLAAAIALARAGSDAGHRVLIEGLNVNLGIRDPEDEHAAIELAGELKLKAARPGLVRRAFGVLGLGRHPFAWQARVALAKLGDLRAREAILKGLSGMTRDTRTLAVAAAGAAKLSEALPVIEAMRGNARRADPDAVSDALAALERPA